MKRLTLMFAFAVVLAIAFTNSAMGQYPIVENPATQAQADAAQAKADAAAAKAQADALKKEVDALKKSGPAASSDYNWLWWVLGILVLAAAAVWFFFFRNRGEGQQPVVPEPEPAPAPQPEPAPAPQPEPAPAPQPEPAPAPQPEPAPAPQRTDLSDTDKGDLRRALSAIALFAVLASGVASAQVCSVNNSFGSSTGPIAVVGIDNTVKCNVAGKFTIVDPSSAVVATGTRTATFKPANVGRYLIKVGKVTVTPLFVDDKPGAGRLGASQELISLTPKIDSTARTQAQQANVRANAALTTATTAGQAVRTLDQDLKAIANRTDLLEQRMTALESRPATRVDLSPLEQRVAILEAELKQVKATANIALSTAQGADAKATDALNRYEAMGLARFKTGVFKSKTVVEASEDAKARAEKDAEEQRVKAEKAAAKAAKQQK